MLRNLRSLIGTEVFARDGKAGEVADFFFCDESWAIRYVVMHSGDWLVSRRVLLRPCSIAECSVRHRHLSLDLTLDEVAHSLDIDADLPVYRQRRSYLDDWYGWPAAMQATGPAALMFFPSGIEEPERTEWEVRNGYFDQHLRSAHEVAGYRVCLKEGDCGHVEGFIIDDDRWVIPSLIVGHRRRMTKKRILLPSSHAREIDYWRRRVIMNLSLDDVKDYPGYPGDILLGRN
jgi:hypothetical protein